MATFRKMLKDKDGNNIIPITRELAGPSIVAFITAKASNSDFSTNVPSGETFSWSDHRVGQKAIDYEYDPYELIASQSGAIYYTHKSGVKFIKATVTFSGRGYGIWQNVTKNSNQLNGAVIMNSSSKILKIISGSSENYGGCTFDIWYDVRGMNEGDSFFINPQQTAYNSAYYPGNGGTSSSLEVTVYGQ